jgi:hypothetical protein
MGHSFPVDENETSRYEDCPLLDRQFKSAPGGAEISPPLIEVLIEESAFSLSSLAG